MARGKKKPNKEQVLEDPKDEYLSLFVKDGSEDIMGETIGVEGPEIVIKKGKEFFKVPLSHLEFDNDRLRIVKSIDWEKARKKGEKWKKRELDPL